MRFLFTLFIFALISTARAEPLELEKPLPSEDFGFGPGIVIQEVSRQLENSMFKIVRNYEYKGNPSIAWGTPQNWFVMCALRKIAERRGFTKIRMDYQVMDNGKVRAMNGTETFASIGSDQLYLHIDWLSGEVGDVTALLKQNIIPFNKQLDQSCERFKFNGNAAK
jgi:hypothetical protein